MSECHRVVGRRVLAFKLSVLEAERKLLEAEKGRLTTEAEAKKIAWEIQEKLRQIEKTKNAILDGLDNNESER